MADLQLELECAVCLEHFTRDELIYDCRHIFCIKCTNEWKGECPLCRASRKSQLDVEKLNEEERILIERFTARGYQIREQIIIPREYERLEHIHIRYAIRERERSERMERALIERERLEQMKRT